MLTWRHHQLACQFALLFLKRGNLLNQIFHKVVWQHMQDAVGSLITALQQVY